jgi:hypothetical protein
MLMSSAFAPGDLGAHRLHVAVPEGSRQLQLLPRGAFGKQVRGGISAKSVKEGVVRG